MSEIETKQFEPYYGLGGWLLYLQIGLGINLIIIIYRLANIISIMHLNWLDVIKLLFTTLIGVSIGASIWITYVFKSERIKNTLRKVGQEKTEYEIYIEEVKSESSANNENELQENIR